MSSSEGAEDHAFIRFLAKNWQWMAGAIGGLVVSAFTVGVWVSDLKRDLEQSHQMIRGVREDIAGLRVEGNKLRECILTMLMDPEPDKLAIVRALAVEQTTLQGIKEFREGEYVAAFESFESAAAEGDPYAISATRAAGYILDQQKLTTDEREAYGRALKSGRDRREERASLHD